MALSVSTIKPAPGARHKSKRVGRGNASQKGSKSGRGTKGQRARSGGKRGTARLGFKQSLQKIPKQHGFTSLYPKSETVTLATLERIVLAGDVVTPHYLKARKAIGHPEHGVKIVGNIELTKKIMVHGCLASKSAAAAIEKAGGSLKF